MTLDLATSASWNAEIRRARESYYALPIATGRVRSHAVSGRGAARRGLRHTGCCHDCGRAIGHRLYCGPCLVRRDQ